MDAAKSSIKYLEERVKGLGGVIGINAKGDYAYAFNTKRMARGYVQNGELVLAIDH